VCKPHANDIIKAVAVFGALFAERLSTRVQLEWLEACTPEDLDAARLSHDVYKSRFQSTVLQGGVYLSEDSKTPVSKFSGGVFQTQTRANHSDRVLSSSGQLFDDHTTHPTKPKLP